MTFTEIVAEVAARLNLTSPTALTRIGREVNIQHRYVTISCQLDTSRRVTVTAETVIGLREVVFTGVEKLMPPVLDTSTAQNRQLVQVTVNQIKEPPQPVSGGDPWQYAVERIDAQGVTIILDREMEDVRTLQVDAWAKITNISGDEEPLFPESFHTYLVERVIADELKKMNKPQEAKDALMMANNIIGELRLFLAKESYLAIQQNTYNNRWPFRRRGYPGYVS